jgi:beta-galactosidase
MRCTWGKWESTVRPEATDGKAVNLRTWHAVVVNEGKNFEKAAVSWQILDAAGKTVATAEAPAQVIDVDGKASFEATAKLSDPALWSVETPNLYSAIVTVETGGKPRDAERVSFRRAIPPLRCRSWVSSSTESR